MAALSRLAPDRVVPVTAARDGFLLTPDQGPVFHETAGDDLENWVRLARDAALLQRELVPHHDELTRRRDDRAAAAAGARTTSRPGSSSTPHSPPDDPRRLRARRRRPPARPPSRRTTVGRAGRRARAAAHAQPQRPAREQRLRRRRPAAVLRLRRLAADRAAGRAADPAEHPRRQARGRTATTRGCGGWPTPPSRSGATWCPLAELRAALPAALQLGRLGRVESWVALPAVADRRRSSPSGARWPPAGSARCDADPPVARRRRSQQ